VAVSPRITSAALPGSSSSTANTTADATSSVARKVANALEQEDTHRRG
jgi:hypothetical protein